MGSGTGLRELKKDRTRHAIREAAVRLFGKQGYEATTMDQIAAAAQVAPRTLYRYYPAKEDLIFQEDIEGLAIAERQLAERRPGESDFDLVTRSIKDAFLQQDMEQAITLYPMVIATPGLMARAAQIRTQACDVIARGLLGAKPKSRAAQRRARTLAYCLIAASEAAFLSWLDSGQKEPLEKELDAALNLLRQGFGD